MPDSTLREDVAAVQAVMHGQAPRHVVNAAVLDHPRFVARLAGYARNFA